MNDSKGRKVVVPNKLIIDGTLTNVLSAIDPRGNRDYYEVLVAPPEMVLLLPPRLFFLMGCLAMLRDVGHETPSKDTETIGFVHREIIGLSKITMNEYVANVKQCFHKQLTNALCASKITLEERNELMRWPIIESGTVYGLQSHWRLVISPVAISINPQVLQLPNADLQRIGADYFKRHPIPPPIKK